MLRNALTASRPARVTAVVGATLLALALGACGANGTGGTDDSSGAVGGGLPNGTPNKGGALTMVIASVGSSFDPAIQQINAFTESGPMSAIYGATLYQLAGDPKVRPGFVTSFTPSPDFKTWTAVVSPNVKFSDGTPFDAAAIAYNIERTADPATGSIFRLVAEGMKTTVVDPLTLKIELQAPDAQFDKQFMIAFGCIGSPTAMKALGSEFRIKPVGAGPFKLRALTPGQSMEVERNPYYSSFAADQPYLDSITFQAVGSYPQQIAALQNGSAQVMFASGQQIIDQLKTSGLNTYSFQSIGGGSYLFNTRTAPFDDPVAREAVVLALNRATAANVFAPGTPPVTNFFPEGNAFHDTKNDYVAQDKDRAQQLFDELAAKGKPLSFEFLFQSNFPDSVNTAQGIQAQLSTYRNVKVTVKGEPGANQLASMRAGNYQMTQYGLYSQNAVPDGINQFGTGAPSNFTGWSNSTVDAAIAELHATQDEAKQKESWATILEQLNKDNPLMFVNQGVLGFAATKNITGIQLIGLGFIPLFGPIGYAS